MYAVIHHIVMTWKYFCRNVKIFNQDYLGLTNSFKRNKCVMMSLNTRGEKENKEKKSSTWNVLYHSSSKHEKWSRNEGKIMKRSWIDNLIKLIIWFRWNHHHFSLLARQPFDIQRILLHHCLQGTEDEIEPSAKICQQ